MKATEHNGHHRSALHNQNATARHDALASQIDSPSAMEGLSEKYSTAPEPSLNPEERRARIEALLPVSLKCLAAVSKLDEGLLVALLQEASICTFKQKEVVLEPGENDDRIHMVVDGVVTLHTYTENGRQIINDYLGRGYFFGETALTDPEGSDFWANSKGGCAVASISRERFMEVGMAHPALLRTLTNQLIQRLHSADHKACDLAFLDFSGRVANALQQLAKGSCAITHPDGMQIRMTRQEIGLIVGCSREMVGRAIKVLAHQGDIN